MRVNESLDVIVRPWARRLPGGDWDVLFYQAQIRYQPVNRLRIDAGILSSTLGMATLEMRQDLNPAVASPFYYFGPVPRFEKSTRAEWTLPPKRAKENARLLPVLN